MEDADGYFPERVAATYDDSADGMFDPAFTDTVAEVLAGLAGGGRALEFGIGTGRIALPLARRGVEVHGIDLSRAMVARLRAKPGGETIPVAIGDFATTTMDGTFARRPRRVPVDPVPVRVAVRARPDGAAGRDAAARPVGGLEPGAVHR